MNNPAVKRLAKELQEIQLQDCDDEDNCIQASPLKVKLNGNPSVFSSTFL
jgi:hypothetical protein